MEPAGVAITIAISLFILILLAKGVRIVPQAQNWIVERFGKYVNTLSAGLNLINPIFSRVVTKIDIREQVLDLPRQAIITSDNAAVDVNGVVFFKIMDPYKAYYGIENLAFAISNIAKTTLRSIMGQMSLDETLSNRQKINAELLVILDEATDAWGTKITRVEIQDILPPKDIEQAMAQQMKAERQRRATVLEAEAERESAIKRAEGHKRSEILQAEAQKESAELEAEARERLALAEANALKVVSEALRESGSDPSSYLLGQQYVQSLLEMSKSSNGKIIMLPPDVMETVKGLFGKK